MVEKRHSKRRAGERATRRKTGIVEREFAFTLQAAMSHGKLLPGDLPANEPTLLNAAMVTRTELRFRAAEYFLALTKTHLNHETAVLYHVQAFLGAFRSTRELLDKECKSQEGFRDWYAAKREAMDAEGLRVLFDLRNESEHAGIEPPSVEFLVEVRHHLDGRMEERLLVEHIKIHGVSIGDPLPYFDDAMALLRAIIVEAKEHGFLSTASYKDRQLSLALRVLKERPNGSWRRDPSVRSWTPAITALAESGERTDLH